MASVPQESVSALRMVSLRIQKWAARSRSWIGILLLVPFLVGTLLSVPWSHEGAWGDWFLDLLGWLLFFLGAATRWWSTLYIGGRKTTSLVTDGPYSICRNPLYVGTFLMGLAAAAFLQSLTFMLGLVLVTSIYIGTTVPVEERRLRERFDGKFEEYCSRVPRLIPNFRRFRSPPVIDVTLQGLAAESYRAVRWIWLPIICELITQLRAQPYWPHVFRLP